MIKKIKNTRCFVQYISDSSFPGETFIPVTKDEIQNLIKIYIYKKPDVSEQFLCSETFQNTANIYDMLHIVNDLVDIECMQQKVIFKRSY